ncbi:MAG: preprotein translocase subunit SecG [Chloroflexaceae bacterium]|nr:preprotein translocase subunit SecG [Chloroflexaceae bacterium]
MELALFVAMIILSIVLIALVVLQVRTTGMANRDASSLYRTKRGVEKTFYQATIVLSAVYLVLALITSLPIFN